MTESSPTTQGSDDERICPICQASMHTLAHEGARADVCAEHGAWLDDGELEKLISRARKRSRGNRAAVDRARRKGVMKGLFWGAWALLDDGSDSSRRSRSREIPILKEQSGHDNAALVPEGARKCPVCNTTMKIESQNNIIIDCCPEHGVWLDGDELSGIISRTKNRARLKTRANLRRAHRDGVIDANLFGLFSLFR